MFQKGDLVKWYLVYDVGVLKSQGTGVILDAYNSIFFKEPVYTYKVYRNEYKDIMLFEQEAIELFRS